MSSQSGSSTLDPKPVPALPARGSNNTVSGHSSCSALPLPSSIRPDDLRFIKQWTWRDLPLLLKLKLSSPAARRAFLSSLSAAELRYLKWHPQFTLHKGQLVPGLFSWSKQCTYACNGEGFCCTHSYKHPLTGKPWRAKTVLLVTGRGFGKNTVGSHWIHDRLDLGFRPAAIVGQDSGGTARFQANGETGIIKLSPPHRRTKELSSKAQLQCFESDGSVSTILSFSGEATHAMRGNNGASAWLDEWLFHDDPMVSLHQAQTFNRLPGNKLLLTTTPESSVDYFWQLWSEPTTSCPCGLRSDGTFDFSKRTPGLCTPNASADPLTLFHHGSLFDNPWLAEEWEKQAPNLKSDWHRVELLGLLTKTVGGSVWGAASLDTCREFPVKDEAPAATKKRFGIDEVWVSVDPAMWSGPNSDETGIVVVGFKRVGTQLRSGAWIYDVHAYVLEDGSGKLDPKALGQRVKELSEKWGTWNVLVETNQGGGFVTTTLKDAEHRLYVKTIHHSTVSKGHRARDAYSKYQLERVKHVGEFPLLERQMTSWDPGDTKAPSPDRMDALVNVLLDNMPAKCLVQAPPKGAYPKPVSRPQW